MPRFGPLSRRDLIGAFRKLGWAGPFVGKGKHPEFMIKGERQVKLPNPHRGDIGPNLLNRLLAEAGISRDEWDNA